MIAEMIIGIAKEDIEGYPTIKFMKVLLNVGAIPHDEIQLFNF
jgi:hypothetical protein